MSVRKGDLDGWATTANTFRLDESILKFASRTSVIQVGDQITVAAGKCASEQKGGSFHP